MKPHHFRLLSLFVALLLSIVFALQARSSADVCLTRAEVTTIRKRIAGAKATIAKLKEKIEFERKQATIVWTARLRSIQAEEKACRITLRKRAPCPRCNCLLPWVATGVAVGVCGGVIITRELSR